MDGNSDGQITLDEFITACLGELTVRKIKRDAGPKHVCEGKFHHPSGSIYSMWVMDISIRPMTMWMTDFSITYMFLVLRQTWFF
jgi:hypothetical protein